MNKILLFIFIFFLFINIAYANEIEDTLNEISNQIQEVKSKKLDPLNEYPVGSIYLSTSSKNPREIMGGMWESFATGRTLVGINNTDTAGITGGQSTVSLITTNLPSHTHSLTAKGNVSSTFTGASGSVNTNYASHTHTLPFIQSNIEAAGYGMASTNLNAFGGRIIVKSNNNWTLSSTSDAHSHTLIAKGNVSSIFTGTSGTTTSVGQGTAINVLNPYITVYMWKRTA